MKRISSSTALILIQVIMPEMNLVQFYYFHFVLDLDGLFYLRPSYDLYEMILYC